MTRTSYGGHDKRALLSGPLSPVTARCPFCSVPARRVAGETGQATKIDPKGWAERVHRGNAHPPYQRCR